MHWAFSILFHIGIWLFDFSFVVFFCAISILFISCWGPIEAFFLSRILSNGLSCAHKLRASYWNHEDFCFHHLQTLFVEGRLVRKPYLRFFSSFDPHFLFSRFIEPVSSCSISESDCLIFHLFSFCVILVPYVSFWGPIEATFFSWILPNGNLAPTNWESPTRNTKTPVSKICKHCFWKGDLSETHIYFFSSFD